MKIKPIIEIDGWILKNVYLTSSGRKKVKDLYDYVYENEYAENRVGVVYTADQMIKDIEMNATDQFLHPVCKIGEYYDDLVENVDYVIEMQSEEAFELEIIAKNLNELHILMQSEMQRLGW